MWLVESILLLLNRPDPRNHPMRCQVLLSGSSRFESPGSLVAQRAYPLLFQRALACAGRHKPRRASPLPPQLGARVKTWYVLTPLSPRESLFLPLSLFIDLSKEPKQRTYFHRPLMHEPSPNMSDEPGDSDGGDSRRKRIRQACLNCRYVELDHRFDENT